MSNKKGFTLLEIIVVMLIVGLLASIALPNYFTMINQGAANATQNNLIAIYNAQLSYYNTANAYCIDTIAPKCDNLNDINTSLSLNINDPGNNNNDGAFTYKCVTDASGFSCTATNLANTNFKITLINGPIVLLGGAGCTTTAGASCNPTCAPTGSPYCPT